MSQKIVANLWFNKNAAEAVEFYTSVFPDSKIISKEFYPKSQADGLEDFQADLAGELLSVEFELRNIHFTAINAGPEFSFTEAISFAVYCQDQVEIDYYWEKLSDQADSEQCGWCKDKYGLSWQIIPHNIEALMKKPDAFSKLMKMKKIVIADF